MADAGPAKPYRQSEWTAVMSAAWPRAGVLAIALYLAQRADFETGELPRWVTKRRIADDTGLSIETARVALRWLRDTGLLLDIPDGWVVRKALVTPADDSRTPGGISRTPRGMRRTRGGISRTPGGILIPREGGHPDTPPGGILIPPRSPDLPIPSASQPAGAPACLPVGACPPASAHAPAYEKTPEPMLATEPGMDGAASHPPASAPPAPGVMEYSDAPDDSARIDALAARIAEALFVAYNDGVSAESAGSFVGVGRVADAIPAARWLIANVGALPDLPRGATEAQIVAVASAAGEAWGRWLQRPSDKPKGNRPPVPRPAPRPLRWLCAPAQDFATLRAQLDRHRERAQRPNNGVRVTTTPNGEITMATETTEKRAAALIRHFAEHPAPPEHQEGRAQRAEVTAYLIDHPTSPLVERWQRVLAQWAQWEQA